MKQVEAEHLLRDCRELLTNRMRTSMSRMLGEVEDVLFEKATSGHATAQTSHYIEAVREIRMKKREIQIRFENRFLEQFDYSVLESRKAVHQQTGAQTNPVYPPWVIDINQVRSELFEQRIEKMRGECRSALVELDRHVSELLQSTPQEHFDNPLEPKTVFNAFRESCRDIQIGADIRQILMERFDKYIGPALQDVYADLNHLFQNYNTATVPTEENGPGVSNPDVVADGMPEENASLLVGKLMRETIRRQVAVDETPDFVTDFLYHAWSQVLERVYERYGANAPEWDRVLQVVSDLQDCTRLTADRDKRQQQLWTLPGLIYKLKAGMKTVSLPLREQTDFLRQLKLHHARYSETGLVSRNDN
jgi:hypothetical protein